MNCDVTGTEALTAAAVRDAFMDLICQDDDLVRAEFDAIVATWHNPPDPPPAPPQRPPPGVGPRATPAIDVGRRFAGSTPARRHCRRQRAPP